MKIEGSVAFVTGSNRGLGAEYVRQLRTISCIKRINER